MNDALCIATLRCLALDMIDQANSGHPGMALGSAPILHTLFSRHLVSTAADSSWIKRNTYESLDFKRYSNRKSYHSSS